MLLSVVLGTTASASAVLFAHYISFGVTIALIILNTWMLYKSPMVETGKQFGPLLLCIFSSPLLLCNPIVNLLEDRDRVEGTHALHTTINFFTWVGVLQMTVATSWNSGLHKMIYSRCCNGKISITPSTSCPAIPDMPDNKI